MLTNHYQELEDIEYGVKEKLQVGSIIQLQAKCEQAVPE
ncbi:hypothetical protein Syncc8109_0098 [Synechococcus sp. WH 8109]|nr:hypothetical protein Syncc8109_0098 [Synechococcus sp. WH 8109]